MKTLGISVLSILAIGIAFSIVIAAGDIEKGKALFKDPSFAEGKRACDDCHPDGKGLEKAAGKKEFRIMGKKQKGLEAAVNFCIENATKGKPINPKSEQMTDIVAYIKSLSGKAKPKK